MTATLLATLLLLSASTVYATPLPLPPPDCNQWDDQAIAHTAFGPLHWDAKEFPLTLLVDFRLTTRERMILDEAVTTWNRVLGFTAFQISPIIVGGKLSKLYSLPFKGPFIPITYIDDNVGAADNTAGITSLSSLTAHINNAIVLIKPKLGSILRTVIIHELGHVLGLGHDPNNALSIMHPVAYEFNLFFELEDIYYVRSKRHLSCQ